MHGVLVLFMVYLLCMESVEWVVPSKGLMRSYATFDLLARFFFCSADAPSIRCRHGLLDMIGSCPDSALSRIRCGKLQGRVSIAVVDN